jgi:peptidoglycan-associated lipoprotein
MKVSVRAISAILFLPITMLLFTGCGKKAVKGPEEAKITQSIATTRPAPRELPPTRPSTATPGEDQSSQLLALRGEDIPISEPPSLEFIDPSNEDRQILRNIYFDFDRSNIKPEFQPVMEGIAEWLNRNGHKQLLIEGHCDERGTSEYNLALGERRSLSVRKYLVGLGISPDRLHTISYGEEKPAVPGHDETAWAENRRAEFKVSAN